ncbi:unnamed protein product [Schistosoma rodhaini]|uniref:ARID domain-containing protein n=2 Tax=Schistosoma rodhaini TaxID=6188 RepID=A0AA85EQT5_9TREM|nr:unnamed protein product [Schistosoma rodhaini]
MSTSSISMDKTQVSSVPENEALNSDAPGSGQCFPSSFLTVGTAVSAKYRGAFCEATVDHVDLKFRLRVQLKTNKSYVSVDETCLISGSPVIGNEVVVRVANETALSNEQAAIVIRVTDSSIYTVVFDDGDKRTLRRTQLVIKGERHFKESESLDCLPLTNPEQFRQPVIDQRRKYRSGEDGSSILDENMDEIETEDVDERSVIKDFNQTISYQPNGNSDKLTDRNDADDFDPNCSNITEQNDEGRTRSLEANTNISNMGATDLKHLPASYCRLLGRLVMVDMPLTGKDGFGSPSYGSSTPACKSSGVTPRRRFTPAVVVLPSAMPSIDLGSLSNIAKTHKSYKFLVRSFKDNRFLAVPVEFVKRLKRPDAVELAHTYPALRPAFERALLWLDRHEFPVSWGENAVQTMLGTKNWRHSRRRSRQAASDFTDSINSSPLSSKHTRASSSSSSEAPQSPNTCQGLIQNPRGRPSKQLEHSTRKRLRQSDKTQGSRSSSRLKLKRLKGNILRSIKTDKRQSDVSSNESFRMESSKKSANYKVIKKSTNSHRKSTTSLKYEKNPISGGDLFDSVSSNEASANSSESDSDTGSISSSTSSNITVSTVSTPSSISSSLNSSSSSVNSSSISSSDNSGASRSYNSSDNSSTSSVAKFEARDRWIAQLYRFMDERGTPINKAPSLANKDLDLYKLYKLVHKLGGFHRVSSQLKWGYVYSKMDLPQNFSAGPRNLQAAFKKYLYPWDDISKKLGTNLCELPLSRPRYPSSAQNSNTNSTGANTNNSASNNTSQTKQSLDSGNVETESKYSNINVTETVENSSVGANKDVRTVSSAPITTIDNTITTTTIKKRTSDKASQQLIVGRFKQSDDEHTGAHHNTPIRKSTSSSPSSSLGMDKSSNFVSTTDDLDKPISSASSNSSSKSAPLKNRKRFYDSTMLNLPLLNFGRESVDKVEDLSNCIIPVRSRVRVRCGDHVAYEAKILKHLRPQPALCGLKTDNSADSLSTASWSGVGDIQYRVHYMGWNTRHDEVVPRSRIISVIEWGRGTDEDRPQSCSSLSPIVHEPQKSTLKNQNIVTHSKRECDRSLGSAEINVNEKDREIFKYFATEDAHEDEESIHSQTTETASDNITTTAPIVRRRRLMFSSLKPGRRLSSRKLSISKRNEFCSKKTPKLPLLASGCLPKPHSSVSRDSNNNSNTEKKLEDTNAGSKKLKTTSSGFKTKQLSINLRGRISKKIKPIKRPHSNLSIASDVFSTSSPNRSSVKLSAKSKKLKMENLSNESINSEICHNTTGLSTPLVVDTKRLVTDRSLSVDCKKEPIDFEDDVNQASSTLHSKLSCQRDQIEPTRTSSSSSGLISKSKLSTLKSKISSSSTIRAKNLVSKLSKLAKRKVTNELRILSRQKSKRNVNNDKHQPPMNDDSSKNKLSSGSPSILMISKEYKNIKSSLLNDNKQMVMNEYQNAECSLSNNSTIIRVDEENKSIPSNEKPQKSITKRNRPKEKGTDISSYHLQKKLNNTTDTLERGDTTKSTCTEEKLSDLSMSTSTSSSGSSGAVLKKIDEEKVNIKSPDKLLTKKSSKSTMGSEQAKTTKYNNNPTPLFEDISDAESSNSNERKSTSKLSRSRLSHSTQNSSNSSPNTFQKHIRIIKSSTTISNGSSNTSDTDDGSEQEIHRSFETSHNESSDGSSNSSSESVYGPNDALPRLTRSQHKQLLGDTPPGSALQTASPAICNRTASSVVAAKLLSNSKRSRTKEVNKIVQSKNGQQSLEKTEDTNKISLCPNTDLISSSLSSEVNYLNDNVPNVEAEVHLEETNIHKTKVNVSLDNEISEDTEINEIDLSIKQETIESSMNSSAPHLSPEIIDDNTQVNDSHVNELKTENISPTSITMHNRQEKVKKEEEEETGQKIREHHGIPNDNVNDDDDNDDDQSSVQTMSTDPMDGLSYDLTMSSEKTHLHLSSSKEDEDVECCIDNVHHRHQTQQHANNIPETMSTLSNDENHHSVDDIVNDNEELSVTVVNKPHTELPTIDEEEETEQQQQDGDKVVELEQGSISKISSRSRIRRSSNNSNSTDASHKRGNKRIHSTPHRATGSENSPVPALESPHYHPPTSPHSTIGTSPLPSCSKSIQNHPVDRSISNHRRFGGPFFPIAGFDDLPSDVKCQVLQERMHQILEAWRLAKQYLKDLDQRSNRTRRLKARQNLETLTSSSNFNSTSQNCRQLIDEPPYATNDIAYT